MKRFMKTLGLVVATLVFVSSADQLQAGKHGGGSRGGSRGGSHSRGGGHKSHGSHRSHGSSHRSHFGNHHGSHHGSHHRSHHGSNHHKHHHGHHLRYNLLRNYRHKSYVHYYNAGRTHYHSPYCPAPVIEVERTPVPDGSTLSIHGKWFRSRGHAWMMIADRRFPIEILESTPGALTFRLPHMGVSEPTPARFFLVLPDGLIVEKNYILLTPQAPVLGPVPVHP